MSSIVPPQRPLQPLAKTRAIIQQHGVNDRVVLIGIRGYYRDSMGKPGQNDRGLYDDAVFIVSDEAYASFNANTDPSIYRKHVAVLKPGVWVYKKGNHNPPNGSPYPALRQAEAVTVIRDEEGEDTGLFGINIHRGGYKSTSSLGCQTIFPEQWEAFLKLAYNEMSRVRQEQIKYILVDNR